MERIFSTQLIYQIVDIYDAPSIVMTSCILQKSLSYLDLQLSEHALAKRRQSVVAESLISPSFFQKTFFSSEENLRNCLIPERELLYSLHLDLPEKREYNILSYRYYGESPFNGFISFYVEVSIPLCFYNSLVSELTEEAFYFTNDKFRLLKRIADLDEFRAYPDYNIFIEIQVYFLNQLYSKCKDSNFVAKCVLKLMDYHNLLRLDQPEMVEFFLYSFCKSVYSLKTTWLDRCLVNDCIYDACFRNLRPILNYEDQPYCEEELYKYYRYCTVRNQKFAPSIYTESKMSRERRYQVLQILFFFDKREGDFYQKFIRISPQKYTRIAPLEVSEGLHLIWNSIPDAFVTLEEMQDFYGFALNSDEIRDVHTYYEEAIGQTVSCLEPRKLMHYCKTCIRHILYENNHWLPEGIGQLKIPPKLQDYLNLKF